MLVWPLSTKVVSSLWSFNIPLGWLFLFKTYTIFGKFLFQALAHIFRDELDSKSFGLCRPYSLGHNCLV